MVTKQERNSALLVAAERCQETYKLMPRIRITAQSPQAQVVLLKCDNRQQIRPVLSAIVKDMKCKPIQSVDANSLDFLESTLRQLEEGCMVIPETNLLNKAEQRIGMYFQPGSAIYLPQ